MKQLIIISLFILASCGVDELCGECALEAQVITIFYDGGEVTSNCLTLDEQQEWITDNLNGIELLNPYSEITQNCILDLVVTCDVQELTNLGYNCVY